MSGESNGHWADLSEHDEGLAAFWDTCESLPDRGVNDALDAFVASKGVDIAALVRLGARLAAPTVIAYPFTTGIKLRDVESNRRWAAPGSEFSDLKIVRKGAEPRDTVIVAESETDAAWLSTHYDADVAIQPAGAKMVKSTFAEQLASYQRVLLAQDNDEAGNVGAAKLGELVPHAVRFAPPEGCKDWAEYDGDTVPLPDAPPPAGPGLRTRGVDMDRVVRTEWTWQDRIPRGYPSLLIGNEGIGKGTLVSWLLACATRGELPGDCAGQPQRVLIVGDEDAFEPVWVPRLAAAGADLDLVHTLDDGEFLEDFTTQADALAAAIERESYGLVIFDALLDHVDGGKDGAGIYNAKHVRQSLKPLRRVARSTDVAVLGLLHPPKGNPGDFRSLVAGSHQFNALSRSSLLLVPDPDDETRRVLVRGKGNLSAAPEAVEFAITSAQIELNGQDFNVPKVVDVRESGRTVKDLIGRKAGEPKHVQLAAQIVGVLAAADEPMKRKDIVAELGLEDHGPFKEALKYARDNGLIVQAKRNGPYALPDPNEPPL